MFQESPLKYTFLIVHPDGKMIEVEDSGKEEDYRSLVTSILGPRRDYTRFTCYRNSEPFPVFAIVKDDSLLDGSKMQQAYTLQGLAGPVFLTFDSPTKSRGFTPVELRALKEWFDIEGWMTEEEAEETRPEFEECEPF
jgi:hypothetical protein